MKNAKVKPIKAKLGMARAVAGNILQRANAVLAGIFTATAEYPNPPVDMATFKLSVDTLSSDITAALDGGGQKAIAQRNHQMEVVNKLLGQLAHFAEANCKDDMTTFLKSGFEAVSTTKSPSQPLSQFIRKIDQGPNSGQLLVRIVAVPGASSYDLRWAPLGTGGTPGPWTNQLLNKTRPPMSIAGLTAGTTYVFQVRSFGDSGYLDETVRTRGRGPCRLSPQNPLRLSNITETQPDILLSKPRSDFYSAQHPTGDDVYLVLEVSDTTLRYDRDRKLPLYAKSGVPEVWIENLQSDVLLVYRNPEQDRYLTSLTFRRSEQISVAAFPEIFFEVDHLIG